MFDCNAKFCGKSLNDNLLVGPDLTCNLLAILLRFRKWPIAVVADIKAMFSQVFVDKRDQDAFRFLWHPDDDLTEEPLDFRMRTHVFGAESSPCCAAYALRATAKDNLIGASEDVVSSVFRNVYADDVCCSYKSTDIAIDSTSQMRKLLKKGGFYLTKFLSNSVEVLESVPSEDRARDVHLNDSGLPAQKALGVYWDSKCDCLLERVGVRHRPCTRRGVMSTIAQTYDPLGLIQPFLLPAKQILQEVCRPSLHWDDDLADSSELGMHWQKWLHALPQLESISIERSFTLLDKKILGFELHTFSDASISGYGICVYIRVCYRDRTFKCGFVMRKLRVAPIKAVSVPRLELTAAVLAAKTTNFIVNELDFKFSKVFLWIDSTVVLRYLRNESTRFTTFVANRSKILHSLTAVEQWHYVTSNQNPADVASRGV